MGQVMNKHRTGFETDLQIAIQPVLITLVLLGVLLFILGEILAYPLAVLEYTLFSFYALTLTAWLMHRWQVEAGRWMMVPILLNGLYLTQLWLGVTGLLVFAVFPIILAASLVSIPAAIITAGIETIWLLFISNQLVIDDPFIDLGPVLLGIWGMLGVVYLVYYRINHLRDWVWNYFQREQALIEADRDYRLERAQALEDLGRANLQLTRLNQLARSLRMEAEDARRTKEEFVANVSHELRTPLNMITGFSETMLQAPELYGSKIPPALLADLAVIHRNAEHLSHLIDDVLDLSQIDAKQMALTKEAVDFEALVEAAAVAVRPLFESKDLYLKVTIEDHLPLVVCDRTRIREVLLNLFSNAGRFTEQGGVQVKVWQESAKLMVAVSDTGAGIALKDLDKLFEPFQQIDGSLRRRYGGTGLGLSISKRFIELHEGKIWLESEKNVGTTIFFHLPLTPLFSDEEDFLQNINPDWEYVERTRPSKVPKLKVAPRFVLLEKDGAVQRLLARYQDGIEIVPTTTLESALAVLSDTPAQALLINDASVAQTLTKFNPTTLPTGTPVIICDVPSMHEVSLSGVSKQLVKPISREELLTALDQLEVIDGKILIVDDEPDVLQLFGRMLASADRGYQVLLARDGQEALDILDDHQVEAILLDLMMPRMNGFQFLEQKNQKPALRPIPTIVVSTRDPLGQPIVSNALAVTQSGGISAHQLLKIIEMLSQTLSTVGQNDGPMLTKALSD